MALTTSFAQHLTPIFRDIIGTDFKTADVTYSRVLKTQKTTQHDEDFLHATTIPPAVRKDEGAPITFYDPIEGGTKKVKPESKALGVWVSREMWDDDLYKSKSAIRRSASTLSRAYMESVEIDAADIFNSGFTGNTYQTIDYEYHSGTTGNLFDTNHPRLDDSSNTQANEPSSPASLSLSSLRAAMTQFKKWKNDRGIRLMATPKILLVPVDLQFRAEELLRSTMKPGTDSNDVNVTKGAVQVVPWTYLTSETAWFLLGGNHYLYFFWRQRPQLDSYDDRNTKVAKFTIWGRYKADAIHWHEAYGSEGA